MNRKTPPAATSGDKRPPTTSAMPARAKGVTRYHPALVTLHWTLAVLLLFGLATGSLVLAQMPNAAPDKIGALRVHMVMGIAIGVLMLARLIVRWRTSHPPAASAGHAGLDWLRRITHAGLYLLVFLMAASGLATALQAGLPQIVFGNGALPLPKDFLAYPPRHVHGWVATGLFVLIGLHVIGALFHQFALKDRLLARMGFGGAAPAADAGRRLS